MNFHPFYIFTRRSREVFSSLITTHVQLKLVLCWNVLIRESLWTTQVFSTFYNKKHDDKFLVHFFLYGKGCSEFKIFFLLLHCSEWACWFRRAVDNLLTKHYPKSFLSSSAIKTFRILSLPIIVMAHPSSPAIPQEGWVSCFSFSQSLFYGEKWYKKWNKGNIAHYQVRGRRLNYWLGQSIFPSFVCRSQYCLCVYNFPNVQLASWEWI